MLILLAVTQIQTAQAQKPGPGIPPPHAASVMRICGDYLFLLQGDLLSRFPVSNPQQATTVSLLEGQEAKGCMIPPGLLIPVGGNGKAERLLIFLGPKLFVVDPAGSGKPLAVDLPEPSGPGKPGAKECPSAGMGKGPEKGGNPEQDRGPGTGTGHGMHPGHGMGMGPGMAPGMGMGPGPMQPGMEGGPGGPGNCPPPPMMPMGGGFPPHGPMMGPGGFPPVPPPPPLPQMELKGNTLFLLRGADLLSIDLLTGKAQVLTGTAKSDNPGK